MIGMLNFLVNSTMPELTHDVHQCARFCADPKASYETDVKHIIRYLLTAREKNGVQPFRLEYLAYSKNEEEG
eukprot:5145716-Ditylum_brightwellii.AAC.1